VSSLRIIIAIHTASGLCELCATIRSYQANFWLGKLAGAHGSRGMAAASRCCSLRYRPGVPRVILATQAEVREIILQRIGETRPSTEGSCAVGRVFSPQLVTGKNERIFQRADCVAVEFPFCGVLNYIQSQYVNCGRAHWHRNHVRKQVSSASKTIPIKPAPI
jgi:hypothetical protein